MKTQVRAGMEAAIQRESMGQGMLQKECPKEVYTKREGVTYGTIEHKIYHSVTTGLDRGVNILLPAGYSEEKEYPVLYFLHGIFGDENSLLFEEAYHIREIAGNLCTDKFAKEMLIVFPNMYAASDPDLKPQFGAKEVLPYDNFIHDLTRDLMPYIKQHYAIKTERKNQAILGFSMGGRETLYIGLNRPDLFGYMGAIAPAPGLVPTRDWAMEHRGQMTEKELYFKDTANLPYVMMLCCGTQDGTVGKFPESYHMILTENQVSHIWYEIPDADHDEKTIRSGFYNFCTRIFQES